MAEMKELGHNYGHRDRQVDQWHTEHMFKPKQKLDADYLTLCVRKVH
jgi:hypothetical protein